MAATPALIALLIQVFLIKGYNSQATENTIRGVKNVGTHYVDPPTKGKLVDVAYRRCYSGVARRINATVRGQSRYADTFEATIQEIHDWGFKALVQRTDQKNWGWGQPSVRIFWKATFESHEFTKNPCYHDARCSNSVNGISCDCEQGFGGDKCEIANSHCWSNPCHNEGTCIELPEIKGFVCSCPLGYVGTTCSTRVLKGASSVNLFANGDMMTTTVLFDNCFIVAPSSVEAFASGALSSVFSPSVNAIFDWGFTVELTVLTNTSVDWQNTPITIYWKALFDSVTIVESNICLNGGQCRNVQGGKECHCEPQFSGVTCQIEQDPCSEHPCVNGGECTRSVTDGFHCNCPTEYVGRRCQIRKAYTCTSYEDKSPCLNGGQCSSLYRDISCHCTPDFMGKYCSYRKVTGRFLVGAYYQFTSDRKTYQVPFDKCVTTKPLSIVTTVKGSNKWPDRFEGTVTDIHLWGFTVIVRRLDGYGWGQPDVKLDWTARFDQKHFDDPVCKNGGTCSNSVNGQTCECAAGFTGTRCEKVDLCNPDPCENGKCVFHGESYSCLCNLNFVGRDCNIDVQRILSTQ